jgi:hypothetical protein
MSLMLRMPKVRFMPLIRLPVGDIPVPDGPYSLGPALKSTTANLRCENHRQLARACLS